MTTQPENDTQKPDSEAVAQQQRLVRYRLGRVEIDREEFMSELPPCLAIAAKLTAGGFPLNLGIAGPELWHDERWKWGKFREAADKVGATWWAWHEDAREHLLVFEWGTMANNPEQKQKC